MHPIRLKSVTSAFSLLSLNYALELAGVTEPSWRLHTLADADQIDLLADITLRMLDDYRGPVVAQHGAAPKIDAAAEALGELRAAIGGEG